MSNTNWAKEGPHETKAWQQARKPTSSSAPTSSSVYLADPDVTIWHGDVRDVLPRLPDSSVDCVATSPPFYGLRDYGTGTWEGGDEGCDHQGSAQPQARDELPPSLANGPKPGMHGELFTRSRANPSRVCLKCGARRIDQQIGLEATPEQWADELVRVFRECRRVLKDTGTLWVECGDSYATQRNDNGWPENPGASVIKGSFVPPGTKQKDLIGGPWLLAFALRADGWYLRQAIIWHKPNAMPESVTDRCTTAHSYLFLFSKRPRYWFDAEAISEPNSSPEQLAHNQRYAKKYEVFDAKAPQRVTHGHEHRGSPGIHARGAAPGRNARSVWTVPTQGYPEAHFATWPEALCERIIKAGCPEWVCVGCGKPRERIVEKTGFPDPEYQGDDLDPLRVTNKDADRRRVLSGKGHAEFKAQNPDRFIGWSDCGCGQGYAPGTILDPFGGSGTTAHVARKHGRRAILVELNSEYCALAARRLQQLSLLA